MLLCEALEENLDGNRAHTRLEVVEAELVDTKPVGNILRVRQSGREAYKAHIVASLLRDVPHPAHNDLDDGASLLAQQMDLVDDHQGDSRDVATVLPVPADAIPLLGRRDEDVSLLEGLQVGGHVSSKLEDRLLQWARL